MCGASPIWSRINLISQPVKAEKLRVNIIGSDITFDGGVMLLSQIDKKINLKYSAEAYF